MTLDMSSFVDRDNGTPIKDVFFGCLCPFLGMQPCELSDESIASQWVKMRMSDICAGLNQNVEFLLISTTFISREGK